jgi:hypothetical protein
MVAFGNPLPCLIEIMPFLPTDTNTCTGPNQLNLVCGEIATNLITTFVRTKVLGLKTDVAVSAQDATWNDYYYKKA